MISLSRSIRLAYSRLTETLFAARSSFLALYLKKRWRSRRSNFVFSACCCAMAVAFMVFVRSDFVWSDIVSIYQFWYSIAVIGSSLYLQPLRLLLMAILYWL